MSFRLLYVIMVRVSGWLLLLSRSDPLDRGRQDAVLYEETSLPKVAPSRRPRTSVTITGWWLM
jgi:hypothetical protein